MNPGGRARRFSTAPVPRSHHARWPWVIAVPLLTACSASVGQATLDGDETEESIASQLAEMFPDAPTPIITCPQEIPAEAGATFECELTVEGDDAVLPVYGRIDSLDDGKARYSIEVGQPE